MHYLTILMADMRSALDDHITTGGDDVLAAMMMSAWAERSAAASEAYGH